MNWFDRAIGAVSRKISRLTGGLSQDLQAETGSGEAFPGIKELAREAAAEGAVLLRNDGVLPLRAGQTVAVFGRGQIDYFYVGYGSGGDVRAPYRVSPTDGLRAQGIVVDEVLAARYRDLVAKSPAQHGFWGHWPYSHPEFRLSDDEVHAAADRNEVALILIGRAAGEDRENKLSEGSYYLTEAERFLLRQVSNAFTKTVVLLNIGNPIDFSRIEDPSLRLSAVMIVWQGGMESGNALADLITGKVSPSGRLPDTVARRYSDYPSAESFGNRKFNEYREDVYVGYRYFETFAKDDVLYPFGYGLSYTAFTRSASRLRPASDTAFDLDVTVTNVGSRDGKDVVALYFRPPQTELPSPERILCAFQKTELLKPGSEQTVTLTVDLSDFAAFDDKSTDWVTEEGDYQLYLGGDVRSAEPVGAFRVEQTFRRPALSVAPPSKPFPRLTRDKDGSPRYESSPITPVDLRRRILDNLPVAASPSDPVHTVDDVRAGRVTLKEFVSELSLDQLEAITRGDYTMNSPLGAPGNAGVLCGVLPSLRQKGVPPVTTTDGPSGIRLATSCSLLPIGILLASTWNPRLVRSLYGVLGAEMKAKGSDVLLAPGLNLHRNPLCGRNFEYFSEDPFLSGKLAAAVIRGIQSQGVAACPKHFACNNQETNREHNDSRLSQRALRELYLKGFEIAVKEGKPLYLMTSYNKINGVWGHYHYDLVTTVLRGEWGFDGTVITDWWMRKACSPEFPALRDNAYRVRAGVDVLMPGGKRSGVRRPDGTLLKGYGTEDGITLGELQQTAERVIATALRLYADASDKGASNPHNAPAEKS